MKAVHNEPFADGKPIEEENGAEEAKPAKGAKALVALVEKAGVELFLDDRGEAYGAIPLPNGGREIRRVSHKYFKSWMIARHLDETGEVAGREAQKNAVNIIEAKALQRGVTYPLTERFARTDDGTIWIDMGDADWTAIKITAKGWTVETCPLILFRRDKHVAALPLPVGGGSLFDLFVFLNISDKADKLLVLAWLVAAPFDGLPRPILLCKGVKGSAKTTAARVLRSLVDPSLTEVLRPPRTEDELVHHLGKHACPCYDNMSTMADWLSDGMCRAVTGTASEKRQLFTDGESVLVRFKRPIILTGINTPSVAPDLLDRTLFLELQAVAAEDRREEAEFWEAFKAMHAKLFGALLDTLSATLRCMAAVELPRLPRMADFARIGAGMAEALGLGAKAFLTAYERTADRQTAEVLESDPVAVALQDFMKMRTEWEGKTGDLYKALRPEERNGDFPKTAVHLGRRLNVLRPSLREVGLAVEPADDLPDHQRGWRVRRSS